MGITIVQAGTLLPFLMFPLKGKKGEGSLMWCRTQINGEGSGLIRIGKRNITSDREPFFKLKRFCRSRDYQRKGGRGKGEDSVEGPRVRTSLIYKKRLQGKSERTPYSHVTNAPKRR